MSAYFVVNYRVTNDEGYQKYLQAAGSSVAEHGGEVLVVDRASEPVEGKPAPVTVVIRFESKEAARGWYDSPEYQAADPPPAGQQRGPGRVLRRARTSGLTAHRARRPRAHDRRGGRTARGDAAARAISDRLPA